MPASIGYGLLQVLLLAASLPVMFKLALPGTRFLPSLGRLLRDALSSRGGRQATLGVLAFCLLGYLQNLADPWFTRMAASLHGVEDFSPLIYSIEGALTAKLQSYAPAPLIGFFLYVYVCLFPALYGLALLAPHALERRRLTGLAVRVLLLNQLLALPFFMVFSVRETWYADLGPGVEKARLLTDALDPRLEPLFRDVRGIENNFPSLHTSIAVSAFLLLRQLRRRRISGLAAVCAGLVMASTLYLGFHWVCDMLAGICHALLCVWLAQRWQARADARPNRQQAASSALLRGSAPE